VGRAAVGPLNARLIARGKRFGPGLAVTGAFTVPPRLHGGGDGATVLADRRTAGAQPSPPTGSTERLQLRR